MSLFKKPKKHGRNRGPVVEEEGDQEDDSIVEIQANINKLKQKEKDKKKKKEKKKVEEKKATTLLSFEDEEEDEEEEEFKVKKSSASRRLMKAKTKAEKEARFFAEPPPPPPYSPPRSLSTNGANGGTKHSTEDNDIAIVVKDNLPKKSVQEWTLSGKEAEALHLEEEDFSDQEDGGQGGLSDDEDPLQKIIQSGGIPDAMAIHLARKKREAAREATGGKDDFIPIGTDGAPRESGRRARLVREEDEVPDELTERIGFTMKESKKEDEYHAKVRMEVVDSDSEPEWEKMQINKAMSGQQMVNASKEAMWGSGMGMMMPSAPLPPSISGQEMGRVEIQRGEERGLARPVKYDLPGIKERMRKRLEEMKEVGRRHEQDADRACDDMVESQGEIDKTEDEVPRLAAKHRFYQELRGYVTDYTECYDEKVGTINYLETRLSKIALEKRTRLRERRRQDVKDQAEQLAAMTATAAYLGVSGTLGAEPGLEEAKKARQAEREGRRTRRRQAREGRGELKHLEGLSSDDELSPKEQAHATSAKKEVMEQAKRVMEDVVDDFSTLGRVAARLGEWRTSDVDSYQSAYVSLVLHRIFSPIVRHHQLFWSPFTSTVAISEQPWFAQLAPYCLGPKETLDEFSEDPDRLLLSSIAEKVVMAKLAGIVRSGYDPVSTNQTNRLVGCIQRTLLDFPSITPRSKFLKELLQCVVDSIKDSLDNDIYIPMYSKQQTESPLSAHSLFFQRQFWSAFKLFKNIMAWQGTLADSLLVELALDRLLNRYLLLSLRANRDPLDSVDKARQILQVLPAWWLKPGSSELAKLGMLSKWVLQVGSEQGMPRDGVLECAKITKKLGDETGSDNLRELLICQP